jgi:hypothetical protein
MKKYLVDLAERAAASAAEAMLAAWGANAVDLFHVDWGIALGLGGGAAVASILKSIVAKFRGNPESASLSSKV